MRKFWLIALLILIPVLTVACDSKGSPTQPSGNAPIISLFAADSTRILVASTTSIRWEVLDTKADVRIDPAPGNVATVGSYTFSPITTGTFSFTLTARNQFGTTQRFLTVVVN